MTPKFPITSKEAAELVGLADSSIRRICIASNGTIGTKRGHDWWLSRGDVARIKARPKPGQYRRKKRP
jgi:hypothetical protein